MMFRSEGLAGTLSFYLMIFNANGTRLDGQYLTNVSSNVGSLNYGSGAAWKLINFSDEYYGKITVSFTWTQLAKDVLDAGGKAQITFQVHSLTGEDSAYVAM